MRRYDRPLIAAAIFLAALAGFVDALGYLGTGGYFVSFMSGNTTRLSVNASSGAYPLAWQVTGLIGAFFMGAMAGTLIAQALPARRKAAVLGGVTLLLLVAALCQAASLERVALLVTAAAMGAENCTFLRDGEVSIGLTYMTGTLVKTAQRLALALTGGDRWGWVPNLLLWLGFLVGAFGGARAYLAIGLNALWIAVAASAAATLMIARLAARA